MSDSKVLVGLQDKQCFWLKLEGDVRVPWCVSLETYCEAVIQQPGIKSVCVDLLATDNLDSTTLGVFWQKWRFTRAPIAAIKPCFYAKMTIFYVLFEAWGLKPFLIFAIA